MDTQNPQIIVDPLRCPMLSPLGLPVPDYNGCIQLMLGNVVEKKIVPTNQDPKIIQERSHTRFRPILTNGCSGRRVGEAVNVVEVVEVDLPRTVPRSIPRTSPSNRSPIRRRSSSKKDQSYDPSTGIHTSRSSNPAALRRPEKNTTE